MGFISVNLVSIPPENKIMLRATMPMNCASLALWNCNPNPSLPNSMPTTRKSNNAGTPKRYPVLPTMMLTKSNMEPISSMFPAVNIINSMLYSLQCALS